LTRERQISENRLKGFPVLILAILALSLLRTAVIDRNTQTPPLDGDVYVQIEGDVKHPGVYSFKYPPDIKALMKRCGSIKSGDRTDMQLTAVPLNSGEKITVQKDNGKCIFVHDGISSFNRITLGLPISINMESEEGLTAVPGIGPGLAAVIAKERSKRGGFKTLEELKSLNGIGDKTYNKIITYVTL